MNLKAESQKSSLDNREKKHFIKKRALGTDKIRKESNNVIIVPGKEENEYSDLKKKKKKSEKSPNLVKDTTYRFDNTGNLKQDKSKESYSYVCYVELLKALYKERP